MLTMPLMILAVGKLPFTLVYLQYGVAWHAVRYAVISYFVFSGTVFSICFRDVACQFILYITVMLLQSHGRSFTLIPKVLLLSIKILMKMAVKFPCS